MRAGKTIAALVAGLFMSVGPLAAATPAAEQAFLAAYKAAFQAKDANALLALVHTQGVSRNLLDFYLSLLTADFGKGDINLELRDLSKDDLADANRVMVGPGGGAVKLTPTPYRKLVVSVAIKNANGTTTTNTSSVYVADEGDNLRISAPADVK
jgi:hypothetical protein